MKRNYLISTIHCLLFPVYCLLFAVLLVGCGRDIGGGGAVYDTVILTASLDTTVLYSDVAKHNDVVNCGSISDTITIPPDDVVDVTISSTEIPNLPEFVETSRVRLDKVTIKYSPADQSSPALSDQYCALSPYVEPGGSATVPVVVASQTMKSTTLSGLVCNSPLTYRYYVTLRFEGVEVNTNNRESFETTLNINFSDFPDK